MGEDAQARGMTSLLFETRCQPSTSSLSINVRHMLFPTTASSAQRAFIGHYTMTLQYLSNHMRAFHRILTPFGPSATEMWKSTPVTRAPQRNNTVWAHMGSTRYLGSSGPYGLIEPIWAFMGTLGPYGLIGAMICNLALVTCNLAPAG